jgi:hypothetical protein
MFFCACAISPKPLKPEILQIEPSSGPTYGNYPLFIIGNGFDPKARITVGGRSIDDISMGQLFLVKVPPGSVGAADVVVTNPDNKRAVLKGGFVYQVYPVIKSIQPAEGNAAGGAIVFIRGDGFDEGIVVRFGRQKAEVRTVTKEVIQVIAPPHPTGAVDVVVANPGGFSFVREEAFYYR